MIQWGLFFLMILYLGCYKNTPPELTKTIPVFLDSILVQDSVITMIPIVKEQKIPVESLVQEINLAADIPIVSEGNVSAKQYKGFSNQMKQINTDLDTIKYLIEQRQSKN